MAGKLRIDAKKTEQPTKIHHRDTEITERMSEERLQNPRELCVLGRHSLFSSGSHTELSGEVCSVVNFPFRVHSRLLHQPMHLQCGPVVPLCFAAPMF
jgi:hypothetical protein